MAAPPTETSPFRRRLDLSTRTWERSLRSREYRAFEHLGVDPAGRARFRLRYLLVALAQAKEELDRTRRTPERDLAFLRERWRHLLHVQRQDLREPGDKEWAHGRLWLTLTAVRPEDQPVVEIEWTVGPEIALGAGIDCPAYGDEIGAHIRLPLVGLYVSADRILRHFGLRVDENTYRHVASFFVGDGALWWHLWANAFGGDILPWWRRGRLAPVELLLGRYTTNLLETGRHVASVPLPEGYYTAVIRRLAHYAVRSRLRSGHPFWRAAWALARRWQRRPLVAETLEYRFDFTTPVPVPDGWTDGGGGLHALSVEATDYKQAVRVAAEEIVALRESQGWRGGRVPADVLAQGA